MKVIEAARDAIWQSWRATCAENADHSHTKVLFDRNRLPSFQNILGLFIRVSKLLPQW